MLTGLSPQTLAKAEGPAFWFLNNLCVVKATTESTGGAFSMVHQIAPPGAATPYHLHHVEDEAFYVLDGEYTFICDGVKTVVGPGGYMFLPRGVPHGIRASGSTPATMLILATPWNRVRRDDGRDGRAGTGEGLAKTDQAGSGETQSPL